MFAAEQVCYIAYNCLTANLLYDFWNQGFGVEGVEGGGEEGRPKGARPWWRRARLRHHFRPTAVVSGGHLPGATGG